MSVHEVTTASDARRHVVRWREGGRNRQRNFTRRRDAEAWDAEVRRRQQLGPLAVALLDAGTETLDEYVTGAWGAGHLPTLAPKTRRHYAGLYDHHLSPQLGAIPLREITVETVKAWQASRLAAGGGPTAVRQALDLLGTILRAAVDAERIASNPVPRVKKAPRPRRAEVRPLAPVTVEAMREAIRAGVPRTEPRKAKSRKGERVAISANPPRDRALVSVLAYAGLRPGEALALRWGDVRENTLLIEHAVSLGTVKSTKTNASRTVRLLDGLRLDLAEWRMAAGRPTDSALVFPAADGNVWTEAAYESWSRRMFRRAATAAGRADATPYTLRHSFASLLLHEGRNVIYVARQLGHDPQLTLSRYGHVMAELEDAPMMPAEDVIRAARGSDVRSQFARLA